MIFSVALVALGGAVGGVLRFALAHKYASHRGTFTANMLACLLLGTSSALPDSHWATFLLSTGIAGALSTWSTLAKEVGGLERRQAVRYLAITILAGAAFMWLGLGLASLLPQL